METGRVFKADTFYGVCVWGGRERERDRERAESIEN